MTILPNLFFIGIGAGMLWQIAVSAPGRAPQPGDPGPWLLPTCLAVVLILLGAAELLRHWRTRSRSLAPAVRDAAEKAQDIQAETGVSTLPAPPWPARVGFVAVTLGYMALFLVLGFTLSTMVFLLLGIAVLSGWGLRPLASAAVIAVVASLGIGWLLAGVVGVPLPGVLLLP